MSELVIEATAIDAATREAAAEFDPEGREPVPTEAERPVTGRLDASSLESIVDRVCARYGGAREEVRLRAVQLLDRYANARVQAFVSILVEKELRELCRQGR